VNSLVLGILVDCSELQVLCSTLFCVTSALFYIVLLYFAFFRNVTAPMLKPGLTMV
jgi:hypothetical protein